MVNMRPIERTADVKLNTLIDIVERHRRKSFPDNPYNPLKYKPRTTFVGLTNLSFLNCLVWTSEAATTDDTLINPRLRGDFVYEEVRVGTSQGSGKGYESDFAPIENGLKSLGSIVDRCMLKARRKAYNDYYDLLKESGLHSDTHLRNLASVERVVSVQNPLQRRIPIQRLKRLARQCSEILSQQGDDGRVRILAQDEVRRYVNSQGTVIMDSFFGYHLRFLVTADDEKGRTMEFAQNMYFRDSADMDKQAILNFVQNMNREVQIRKKECPIINSGTYLTLFSPGAMASALHEAYVHFLPTDEIVDGSTVWGWENFGGVVSNPRLSVYTDPGMPGEWGSMDFDYEGVPAQRRALIEEGKVVGYLADREGAERLHRETGAEIRPGDSRFNILEDNTSFAAQPRISNIDFVWKMGKDRKQSLKTEFLRRLHRSGKTGIYIPDDSGAGSLPKSGEIEVSPNFPYLVTPEGKFIPVKFATMYDTAARFVKNITEMGSKREYNGHRCGDDDTMATIRAGILCGGGIVDDVYFNASRPKQKKF
ncbi:hypothetical protein J4444_01540 [Candidatus Woesearchaeota archaeon]|nr:hypothetical protein [Candidatus Woesearchaeota archaeon]